MDATPRKRSKIVTLAEHSSMTQRQIAAECHIGLATVNSIIKRYREIGSIIPKKKGNCGRKRKTSPADDRLIVRKSKLNPRLTAVDLTRELMTTTGANIHVTTVRRRLLEAGRRARKPIKKQLLNPVMCKKRLMWAKLHQHWTVNDWKNVLFSDESHFEVHGHRVSYVRKGSEKVTAAHLQQAPKYLPKVIFGDCFTHEGPGALIPIKGMMNSDKYIHLMETRIVPQLQKSFPDGRGMFQQDLAPCHTSRKTTELFNKKNIQVPRTTVCKALFVYIFSYISGITVLGAPSEIYLFGTLSWLYVGGMMLMGVVNYYFILPVFYELKVVSIYEYLELRFNHHVRRAVSFLSTIDQILRVSMAVYVTSLALSQGKHWRLKVHGNIIISIIFERRLSRPASIGRSRGLAAVDKMSGGSEIRFRKPVITAERIIVLIQDTYILVGLSYTSASACGRKVMATVFFDSEGFLLLDIIPHGTTINYDAYVATLKKLQARKNRVRPHREKQDDLLLHDNARSYVSHKTTNQIRKLG
ncbi:hypothetical protein ANN_15544 [Periplaneta americana]|uniref:Transposase Tc1-like domain-containing protein n=1 Tax=Periplaneta americana TaxID=6978 RepID=A0ABQ8SGN3_PERAM|nr:hypothetical protein ANN_15544 [Periplaneta americana]